MISLRQAEDVEEVDFVLKDPEIYERIAEDNISPDEYVTPWDKTQRYMMVMLDEMIIGVWSLYPVNSSTLNIHANILKEYREHGKEAGLLILKWFINDCPKQYQKLNAEIPVIYPDVYYFTKGFGFSDEGTNRLSIMKNGIIVDQHRLGITKDEVIAFLEDKK
jgi:hypothetical protein